MMGKTSTRGIKIKPTKKAGLTGIEGVILSVVGLLLFGVILLTGTRELRDNHIEQRVEAVTVLSESMVLDSNKARAAVLRTLLNDKKFKGLGIAWASYLTTLEALGQYELRDRLFFKALRYLDPVEMKSFLNGMKDIIASQKESKIGTRKAITMTQIERNQIEQCRLQLNKSVNIMKKRDYDRAHLSAQILNDIRLAFPDYLFEPCRIEND